MSKLKLATIKEAVGARSFKSLKEALKDVRDQLVRQHFSVDPKSKGGAGR